MQNHGPRSSKHATTPRRNTPRISFIGFGEAGQAIAAGLRESGIEQIAAWDILFPEAASAPLKAAGEKFGVRVAASAAEAVRDTDMVISAVTAASSLEAARSVEPHLSGAPCYLDINSVSPGRKQATAELLVGADTGRAAAIKMIRSVMIKGIEALTLECFLAASRAGVLDEVTVSLKNNYPGVDWPKMSEYNLERMASHGERRAAEMEESAATLRELGLDPPISRWRLTVESTISERGEETAITFPRRDTACVRLHERAFSKHDVASAYISCNGRRPPLTMPRL